jgi:hypothetical protein
MNNWGTGEVIFFPVWPGGFSNNHSGIPDRDPTFPATASIGSIWDSGIADKILPMGHHRREEIFPNVGDKNRVAVNSRIAERRLSDQRLSEQTRRHQCE